VVAGRSPVVVPGRSPVVALVRVGLAVARDAAEVPRLRAMRSATVVGQMVVVAVEGTVLVAVGPAVAGRMVMAGRGASAVGRRPAERRAAGRGPGAAATVDPAGEGHSALYRDRHCSFVES
jgi:hypothetical protein